MGGCRCTYKNCTVRSDGKTHLFHYPVFDKVRCHEWLSKAGRYDFLNLKVSQLKNRCICQHHFTDDWFMNDKKEKLKSKAVPTLDGPFCDSSKFKDPEMPPNMLGLYPLACEVIENDDFMLDRKSNYNLLYADFLTNGDAIEPLKISEDSQSLTNIENVTPISNNYITTPISNNYITTPISNNYITTPISNNYITTPISNNYITTPISNNYITDVFAQKARYADAKINGKLKKDFMDDAQEIIIEVPALPARESYMNIAKEEKPDIPQLPLEVSNTNVSNTLTTTNSKNLLVPLREKSKVRIISEKKITEPEKKICVPVSAASFEVVKPSMILSINKNKSKGNMGNILLQSNSTKEEPTMLKNNSEKSMINDMVKAPNNDKVGPLMLNNASLDSCKEEQSITEILSTNDPSKFEIKINLDETMPPPPTPPKMTSNPKKESNKLNTIKNKMSPERLARINEKRKFNMKLKDIIAEELSRLEEQAAANKDILVPKKKITNKKLESETVRSSLAKDPRLPNDNAYIVHYLEARMEKMENLLLNKIDQNTHKIMDLKKTLDTQENIQPESKKTSTKPKLSEEAHKKQLYQEISKYLTPNSNSLIYEELFINKYDPNEATPVPSKRRRTRQSLRS